MFPDQSREDAFDWVILRSSAECLVSSGGRVLRCTDSEVSPEDARGEGERTLDPYRDAPGGRKRKGAF